MQANSRQSALYMNLLTIRDVEALFSINYTPEEEVFFPVSLDRVSGKYSVIEMGACNDVLLQYSVDSTAIGTDRCENKPSDLFDY